jgi:hypothetical protein
MDRMFGEIDRNRRCFFNMAAMTLAAALMIAAHVWHTVSVSTIPTTLKKCALWTSHLHSRCIKEPTKSLPPNICGGSS